MAKHKVWSMDYGVAVTSTHQGKVHDYLDMIFDFLAKGKVMDTMMEYSKTILNNFPEEDNNIPCCGPPVHGEGPVSGEEVTGITGNGIPSCDRPAPVSEHEGASRHSASHCLSHHASEVPRQRRLGQGQEGAE